VNKKILGAILGVVTRRASNGVEKIAVVKYFVSEITHTRSTFQLWLMLFRQRCCWVRFSA
jgi:hypothetical protein